MIALYRDWARALSDHLARRRSRENDWDGFRAQTAALGNRMQIVGDDLLVTNPIYIRRGNRRAEPAMRR